MITYPEIDKVAVAVGPVKVHWYGIMYVVGFFIAYLLLRYRASKPLYAWQKSQAEDLVFYGMIGLFLGARLFYMFVYGFEQLVDNPLNLVMIHRGGMSFHGGLLGVMVALWVYARRHGRSFFETTDFVVPAIPPGLFFGRLGNFINGELWGKPTELPWGFIYEGTARPEVAAVFADGQARHPSQLYEGIFEGLVLFVIVWLFSARPRPVMAVSGLFLLGYGAFRFAIEFIRIPDEHLGYLAFGWLTMGQLLTLPVLLGGAALLVLAYRNPKIPKPANTEEATT